MNALSSPGNLVLAIFMVGWVAGCQTPTAQTPPAVKPPEAPVRIGISVDPVPPSDVLSPEEARNLPPAEGQPQRRRDRLGRLLRSEKAFDQFAMAARREVAAMLVALDQQDPESRQRNLKMRLDLAIYLSENNTALSCISRLRQLEPNAERSAYFGMLEESLVAARRSSRVDSNKGLSMQAFGKDFAKNVAELPKTAAVRAVLEEGAAALATLNIETVEQELREKVGPALERGSHLTSQEAGELVNARHQLINILPLRETALAVLNAAIAARPSEPKEGEEIAPPERTGDR